MLLLLFVPRPVVVVQLGALADWFSAIGTIASVLVVGLGLRWEIRRRRQDDERAEANQARLVTVRSDRWIEREETKARAAHLIIQNHSEAPVHHVDAGLLITDASGRHTIRVPGNLTCSQQLYLLEPSGERDAYYWPDPQPTEDPHAVTWITFVDARGQKWGRIDNGEPRKLR